MCVCVFVCVCVRACVCARVCVRVFDKSVNAILNTDRVYCTHLYLQHTHTRTHSLSRTYCGAPNTINAHTRPMPECIPVENNRCSICIVLLSSSHISQI